MHNNFSFRNAARFPCTGINWMSHLYDAKHVTACIHYQCLNESDAVGVLNYHCCLH
jgi:hypothetical protein